MKYKLDASKDVDICGLHTSYPDYILNLPNGFRFYDDLVHVRGFDSMQELKKSARTDVVVCNCKSCQEG